MRPCRPYAVSLLAQEPATGQGITARREAFAAPSVHGRKTTETGAAVVEPVQLLIGGLAEEFADRVRVGASHELPDR